MSLWPRKLHTRGETVDLARVLARQMPDKAIASVLNRASKTTGRGNGWDQVDGMGDGTAERAAPSI